MVSSSSSSIARGLSVLFVAALVCSSSAASNFATCCDGTVVACPADYRSTTQLDLVTGRAVSGVVSVGRFGGDISVSLNATQCFVVESVSMWLSHAQLPMTAEGRVATKRFPYAFPLNGKSAFSAVFSTDSLIPAASACADGVTFALSAQTKCVCSDAADCGVDSADASSIQTAWVYGAQAVAGVPFETVSHCCGARVGARELEARVPIMSLDEGTTGESGTTGEEGTTGEVLPPASSTGALLGTTGGVFDTTGSNDTAIGIPAFIDAKESASAEAATPLSAGVIAGMVVATAAVAAAIAAVLAKTAFNSTTAKQPHWMETAVANPLYQAGEQMFENPLYDPPVEDV